MSENRSGQIFEIEDLGDRLGVMESVVEDLRVPNLSKGELEVV